MDRRVVRTRNAIETAFEELLLENGYHGVTVAHVLERANVGKSTFYAHYQGKEDLLRGLIDSIGKHALSACSPEPSHDYSDNPSLESKIAHLLHHLKQHIGASKMLIATDLAGEFESELRKSLGIFLDKATACMTPKNNLSRNYLIKFLTGALLQIIRDWAQEGLNESPDAIAQDFTNAAKQLFEVEQHETADGQRSSEQSSGLRKGQSRQR